MRYPHGLALLLVLVPGAIRAAEDTPEQLLPATTQIFLRWDGIDAHQAAYSRTSLGQMMSGDTGRFITGLFAKLQTYAGSELTKDLLGRGENPKTLMRMQTDAKAAATLFPIIARNGFVIAAELRQLDPPQAQVFFILPGMGAKPEPLFGDLRLAASLAKTPVKEQKFAERTVANLDLSPVHLAWWVEGKHAVVTLGSDNPETVVKNMTASGRAALSGSPLFKRLAGFNQFETSAARSWTWPPS